MGRKIVTVSREAGAYGHEVVEALHQRFGMLVLDEASLPLQKGRFDIPDFPLEHFDEKKPSLWDSFSMGKERYLSFLKTAVLDLAIQQDLVISGHGGAFILAGIPGVITLRLVADENLRVGVLQRRDGGTIEQARHHMHHIDRLRRGFNRFFFDKDWSATEHYHVVFNMSRLSVEQVIKTVEICLRESNSADAIPALKDRLMEERAVIELLYKEELDIDLLRVEAHDGEISLQGIVSSRSIVDKVSEVVGKLEGVIKVSNHLRVVDSNVSYLMTI